MNHGTPAFLTANVVTSASLHQTKASVIHFVCTNPTQNSSTKPKPA
jgi:hypothetical protein